MKATAQRSPSTRFYQGTYDGTLYLEMPLDQGLTLHAKLSPTGDLYAGVYRPNNIKPLRSVRDATLHQVIALADTRPDYPLR